MRSPIRVLLVARAKLFRQCLAAALRRRRFEVVGDAATGPDAADKARTVRPDVILLDPEVADAGATLVAGLHRELPDAALLVLTPSKDEDAVRGVLAAGARGYLDEDCGIDDLVQSIDRVRAGELVVGPTMAETAVRGLTTPEGREDASLGLTARQLEVIRLVALGQTNQAIGRELFITEHTVKAHLVKILGKLGLGNRVQLTAYAVEHNLTNSASGSSLP